MNEEQTENKLDTTLNYSAECADLNISVETENFNIDETSQLHEQLSKFIDLVPHLKQINTETKRTSQNDTVNLNQNLQNLDINSKSISDLQILQSILDYITDLQDKANN